MQNLTLVSNSLVGGNIVAVLVRQLIRMRGRQAAAAFRAKATGLANQEISYTPPDVFVAGIPVSVKKQEAYTYRADVTQHAMEAGVILTDHVIIHPVRIDISFETTNWLLDKSYQTHDLMVKLFNQRMPLDLITAHTILRNMILTNYQADNSVPNWGSLDCRASFTQVKYVNMQDDGRTEEKVTPTDNTGGEDNSKSATTEKRRGRMTPREYVLAQREFEERF